MTTESQSELLERFTGGPAAVRAAIAGLTASEIERLGAEGWSIHDVVVHLSDAEIMRALRVRMILASDHPLLPLFDENAWHDRLAYRQRDFERALRAYELEVAGTYELVVGFGREAFERWGAHPEDGLLTVEELLRRGGNHAADHARQIAELAQRGSNAGA